MKSYLVLAYPNFSKENYDWIQSIRKSNDERYYSVVEPHFTIVFPLFNHEIDKLSKHVEEIPSDAEAIKFSDDKRWR